MSLSEARMKRSIRREWGWSNTMAHGHLIRRHQAHDMESGFPCQKPEQQ
jgi:hypothetical protein